MESILTSIKKLLGIEENDENFDVDIIIFINTALMSASMLGLGPPEGFSISDKTATWLDFVGDKKNVEAVKTYVYLKVKLVFDPPQMGYLVDAIESQKLELEFKLNIQAEEAKQNG